MAEGKELMLFEYPTLPDLWDYKESVGKMNQFFYKWKNITQDVANELWIARENLAVPPKEAAIKNHDANASRFTWSDYCSEIGINYTTANRWLNKWFPKEISEGSSKVIKYDSSIIREKSVLLVICPQCNHNWRVKTKEISHD